MGLSPSPCSSLEMVFDLVLFLVMITLFIGFSLRLHPTKVSPSPECFFYLLKNESQSINAKTNNAESYLEIVF